MYSTSTLEIVTANPDPARLREEIETLEQRLHIMGEDGDCAYERAMSKLYRGMVEARKQQLNRLPFSSSV